MTSLDGLRVLVVEDNFVVADSLRTLILAYGGQVAAMVPSVADALPLLDETAIDVAILDIHLKGDKVDRLADRLLEDGIPFLFVTGYGDGSVLPQHLRDLPRLDKPVDPDLLLATLASVLGKS
jgi:CheY-like chemotaxis protein